MRTMLLSWIRICGGGYIRKLVNVTNNFILFYFIFVFQDAPTAPMNAKYFIGD